jgi:hypothetical protein
MRIYQRSTWRKTLLPLGITSVFLLVNIYLCILLDQSIEDDMEEGGLSEEVTEDLQADKAFVETLFALLAFALAFCICGVAVFGIMSLAR